MLITQENVTDLLHNITAHQWMFTNLFQIYKVLLKRRNNPRIWSNAHFTCCIIVRQYKLYSIYCISLTGKRKVLKMKARWCNFICRDFWQDIAIYFYQQFTSCFRYNFYMEMHDWMMIFTKTCFFQVKVYKYILPSCNAVRWGFVRGGGISIMMSSVLFMMSTSVSYLFPSFTTDDSWCSCYRLSSMLLFSCTPLYLLCLSFFSVCFYCNCACNYPRWKKQFFIYLFLPYACM